MSTKKSFTLLLSLLLVWTLLGLSGCGNQLVGQTPGAKPDNLQIEIDTLPLQKTVLNLKDAGLTQQLYALIYALPQMPDNIGCTAEGTTMSYKLTFRLGDKTLGIVDPTDTGCLPVSIKGESHNRQGTKALWSLLNKAIYVATPGTTSTFFNGVCQSCRFSPTKDVVRSLQTQSTISFSCCKITRNCGLSYTM
jgi:hypothetical protein